MKAIRVLLFVISLLTVAMFPQIASAQKPSMRLLHALQEKGYGDMAVYYLKVLETSSGLPVADREILDLEMAKSLQVAAKEAFDAKEYDQLMENSLTYLQKFIQEHPDRPEVLDATSSWGNYLVKRALDLIQAAKGTGDKDREKQNAMLVDARKTLEDARTKYASTAEKYRAMLQGLPTSKSSTKSDRKTPSDAKQELESNLRDALFQTALIHYYLAQTYLDPKSQERMEGLKKAAKEFDIVYQANRSNNVGMYAHMWHGKSTEELGDLQTALDVYDEVLAKAPDPNEKNASTGLEPLFTQVEHFRLLILAKQKPSQFISEANEWLKQYQRLNKTEGYQGIALEKAKNLVAQVQSATSPQEKTKLSREAMSFVMEMTKFRSKYQQEFILLRLELLKITGHEKENPTTFDEAVALGEAAAAAQQWDTAISNYTIAIQLADKAPTPDPSRIAGVRESIANAQLMLAYNLFNQGKMNECMEAVTNILREKKDGAVAIQASALAVSVALNLYASASEDAKPKALKRLNEVAEFMERSWPNRPEADDARMARGQAKLVVGQIPQAIEIFEQVNPKSERYPVALFLAGQSYWRRYLTEKAKPVEERNQEHMSADRAKAVERLKSSLAAFQQQTGLGKAWPHHMTDAQLLSAEICVEGKELKEAAALYQPLIDLIKAEKPETLDNNTMRVFLGAVRVNTALNDLEKASQVGAILLELGPDTPEVNGAIVEFAKMLDLERRKADAQLTEFENTSNLAELETTKKKLGSIRDLLKTVLLKLASQQNVSPNGMVFIGDCMEALDMTAEATQQYQNILKRTENDAEFAKAATKAMARIRSQLIGVLRKEGQFEQALSQVDKLIVENPKALEPRMEKGRILEAWSEKAPSHYPEAVAHWNDLRMRLQQVRGKKPPEYYDVMYRVADCLMRDAQKTSDKQNQMERAKQAEQVLKSTLVLNSSLDGPDTVARYKALLNKAILLQGRQPPAETPAASEKPAEKAPEKPTK